MIRGTTTRRAIYGLPGLLLGVALLALIPQGCGGAKEPAAPSAELMVARDKAAEYALSVQWKEAYEVLRPFVERKDAAPEDLLRAANALLALQDVERARPLVERAEKLVPEDPVLLWCRYLIARSEVRNEEALGYLDRILAVRPDDLPTRLARVIVLSDLERSDQALELARELCQVPVETAGAWRIVALYRYARLLTETGDAEAAKPVFDEWTALKDRLGVKIGEPLHEPGTLGSIPPQRPEALEVPLPEERSFALDDAFFLEDVGAQTGMRIVRYGWGSRGKVFPSALGGEEIFPWTPDPLVVLVFGDEGLDEMRRQPGGWSRTQIVREAVLDAVPFDRTNAPFQRQDEATKTDRGDEDLDLLVVLRAGEGVEVRLLERIEGKWQPDRPLVLTAGGYPEPGRIVPVDYDHDGDLDLLCGLDGRARVLRNDGFADSAGRFTDVTDELGLPSGDLRPITEDLDRDNDVDFLFVDAGTGRVQLWDNQRGGRLVDATARLPKDLAGEHVVAADFDGDGLCDLATFGDVVRVHRRDALGGWTAPLEWPLPITPTGTPLALDWDLDGLNDLVWPMSGSAAAAGLLAPGLANGGLAFTLGANGASGPATLRVADVDGDMDLDLLRLDGTGFHEYDREGAGHGVLIGLRGEKDNSRAVGAIVEARHGLRYRRLYYRGQAELLGFGDEPIDVLRVTWPNGTVQGFLDVQTGKSFLLWQRRGLVGSCPFLYAWNGETYGFVSDVLGITPLGLPMGPGMLVPPDHDEYVLVRGDQLVPKDGFYELQFTEELREVTYLDRIRLDVVDHPEDVEVFPNERFSFPPFPEPHTHTVRAPLAAIAATGSDGGDWTEALAADDGEYAFPAEPYYGTFQGLAPLHHLDIEFDTSKVRDAKKLRLILNGWLIWTNASINMAVARDPGKEFLPPLLQVPDGQGGWRDTGPPLGFPAGKLKPMVLDVTDLLNRDDARVRLVSTLEIHWDSIRLAVDDDDAPVVTTSIEPASGRLWERGFSAPVRVEPGTGLEWFEWDHLATLPRWNQHPGTYTRLGEVLPLLTEIDDRFVIMGAGDALQVRFDATKAPPLREGWKRDFLVFLDGWAKDRDPNTLEALYVEPLPFHGMSGYPYGEGESFPDDEVHREWRREWNTRESRQWIEPLAVRR